MRHFVSQKEDVSIRECPCIRLKVCPILYDTTVDPHHSEVQGTGLKLNIWSANVQVSIGMCLSYKQHKKWSCYNKCQLYVYTTMFLDQ